MHPKLQIKLFDHLKELGEKIQIITSTHSPFLFKNLYREKNVRLLVTKIEGGKIDVQDARASGFGVLKWSPSWGEVCYFAYGLPTVEFHDDLYSSLEDRLKNSPSDRLKQDALENWLVQNGQKKEIVWSDPIYGSKEETLMTYVRNSIHHPDNIARPTYTSEQLRVSTEKMINLLRNI